MTRSSFSGTRHTSVSSIDISDRRFAISPDWMESLGLEKSVSEVGVLNPLRLQRVSGSGPDRYRVVSGFRRLRAAARADLDRVPSLLVDGRCDEDLFVEVVWENLGTRGLELIEKATILRKLQLDFEVAENRLIGEFLPLLNIHPSRRNLQLYLELAVLPEALQKELPDLQTELALKLASWKANERALFLDVYRRCRLGRNKQARFFEILDELRAALPREQRAGGVLEIWRNLDLDCVMGDERFSLLERFDRTLERLWQTRFPVLAEHQRRARHLKSRLRIPPELQFNLPRNLEGDRISVQFFFRDGSELKEHCRRLLEVSERAELKELLDLL